MYLCTVVSELSNCDRRSRCLSGYRYRRYFDWRCDPGKSVSGSSRNDGASAGRLEVGLWGNEVLDFHEFSTARL